MPTDLPLRCACGALVGSVRAASANSGNRVVCYCDDCQSFAHFLGHADDILDSHGGTDIFQTSPARLEITQGREHLACMRLTPGGLVRWYAKCCRTPIGNTLATRQVPFVGLIHSGTEPILGDPDRPETLGPVRARVQGRFAKGDRTRLDAYDRAPLAMILRFGSILAQARLRGDHKRSPFFTPGGELCVSPRVLSEDEKREVEAARDAD